MRGARFYMDCMPASDVGDPERLAGKHHRPGKGQAACAHEHGIPVNAQHKLRGVQTNHAGPIGNEERDRAVFCLGQAAVLLKAGEQADDVFSAGFHEAGSFPRAGRHAYRKMAN